MPRSKDARSVAFFDLSDAEQNDLDAVIEHIMAVIGEGSPEVEEEGDEVGDEEDAVTD